MFGSLDFPVWGVKTEDSLQLMLYRMPLYPDIVLQNKYTMGGRGAFSRSSTSDLLQITLTSISLIYSHLMP